MGKKEILNPTFSLFPKKVTVFVSLKANPNPPPPFAKEVFDSKSPSSLICSPVKDRVI